MFNRPFVLKGLFCLFIAFEALAFAYGSPALDLTNRHVPFIVDDESNLIIEGDSSRALPASEEAQITINLSDTESTQSYGLLVRGNSKPSVTINSRSLDMEPFRRADGFIFQVDSMYLHPGANIFTLRHDAATNEQLTWAGSALFTLMDSYEECHFPVVFSSPEDAYPLQTATGKPETITRQISPDSRQLNYDVLSYDCTFKPEMTSVNFTQSQLLVGTSVIMRAKAVTAGLTQVVIDFDYNVGGNLNAGENQAPSGMVIDSVTASLPLAGVNPTQQDTANNLLLVNFASGVPLNTQFLIQISYHGYPNDRFTRQQVIGSSRAIPLFGTTHNSGTRRLVYTAAQAYGARRWWPCKDQVEDKATTTIQRIIIPTAATMGYQLTPVSNGRLQGAAGVNNGDGTETWTWINDYPISTYLVSMAITNYEFWGTTYTARNGLSTMPIGHYIYPENTTERPASAGTLAVMNFFADTFGEYPYLDEKYVTATWTNGYGMEHQTCTSMPAGSSGPGTNGLTRRNIHEMAHQWFGDKITCADWDHVWLNEGFATYCEALYAEHDPVPFGNYASYVNGWVGSVSTTVPVVDSGADLFPDGNVYKKGGWVFHMLRHVIGDASFFQLLKNYAAVGYTNAISQTWSGSSNFTPVSFQAVAESSAGLSAGSLQPFFTEWLTGFSGGTYSDQPTYGAHGAMTSGTTTQVSLAITQTQAGLPYTMPIDVQFTDANNNKWISVVQNSTSTNTATINTGTSFPVEIDLDPNGWILNRSALTLNTVGLPIAAPGVSYSRALRASSGTTPRTFTLRAGAPAWLSLSTAGVLTGTPPAAGTYTVPVHLADNVGATRDSDLKLYVASSSPLPPPPTGLVINEIFYDLYPTSTTDSGEFVELYNSTGSAIDISNYQVVLVSSAGVGYSPGPITIPASTSLAAGAYYVIGNSTTINAAYPGAVNQNVNLDNQVSDGSPAAIVLRDSFGQRVDSVCYRADATMTAGSDSADALFEGGTGRTLSRALGTAGNASLGRLPNGTDSGSNLKDFANIPPSPGSANGAGVTLPLVDNFDTGFNAAWRPGFVAPVRVAALGTAGKPPVDAGAGVTGNALEVYDSTGGGDVNYLPGAFNQLNFTGNIWIPQTLGASAWSIGLGIDTRCESAWFQNTTAGGVENGFYLEYENGPLGGTSLENGALAPHTASMKFFAVNGSPSLNVGPASSTVTTLGIATSVTPNAWNKFRLVFDVPNNKLYASMNDTDILYNGAIPSGAYSTSGGVVVGFREQHSGNPSTANTEGTWVDNITVNTNTNVSTGVTDFILY